MLGVRSPGQPAVPSGRETASQSRSARPGAKGNYFVVLTLKEAGLTAITVVGPVAKTLILSASGRTPARPWLSWADNARMLLEKVTATPQI